MSYDVDIVAKYIENAHQFERLELTMNHILVAILMFITHGTYV